MKGLLIKEFLGLKSVIKIILIIIAVTAVVLLLLVGSNSGSFETGFVNGLAIIFTGMLCFTMFAYDKQSHWDQYVMTLPVSRKQVVLSKYLFCFLMIGIGTGIAILFNLLFYQVTGIQDEMAVSGVGIVGVPPTAERILLAPFLLFLVAALFLSIMLPILFRFGPEKSRIVMIIVFFALFFVFFQMSESGYTFGVETIRFIRIGLPLIALAAVLLSCLISIRINKKREA